MGGRGGGGVTGCTGWLVGWLAGWLVGWLIAVSQLGHCTSSCRTPGKNELKEVPPHTPHTPLPPAPQGHLDVVEHLLRAPGCDVNARSVQGCTALHMAAQHGSHLVLARWVWRVWGGEGGAHFQ